MMIALFMARRVQLGWTALTWDVPYSWLRLLHFAAIILWVGGGFSLPVVADIRRTLALGSAHGPPLHARLVTTTRLVVPSAILALITGVALIGVRGGFSAAPRRFHIALGLALLIFLVGGAQTNPAITALGRAFAGDDHGGAQRAAGKLIRCLRIEDSLRFTILVLMVLPL
jgi:uncharacterized membrane protein